MTTVNWRPWPCGASIRRSDGTQGKGHPYIAFVKNYLQLEIIVPCHYISYSRVVTCFSCLYFIF